MPRIFAERQGGFPEVINGLLWVCGNRDASRGEGKGFVFTRADSSTYPKKKLVQKAVIAPCGSRKVFPYRKKISLLVMRLWPSLSIGDRVSRLVIDHNRQRCETLFLPKGWVMPTQSNLSIEKNV